jgi:ribonuclease VapC
MSKQLSGSVDFYVSAMVGFEATQALARAGAGSRKPTPETPRDLVDRLITEIGAENLPIGEEIGSRAIEASARYG